MCDSEKSRLVCVNECLICVNDAFAVANVSTSAVVLSDCCSRPPVAGLERYVFAVVVFLMACAKTVLVGSARASSSPSHRFASVAFCGVGRL